MNKTDVRNARKDPRGFASHMEEGADVLFLVVTKALETSSIVLLMVVESVADSKDATSRPSAVPVFALRMEAAVDVP